jgi:single-strand DNA-binding protein
MLNKVFLIGNMGKKPETKQLPSGDCVLNARIATHGRWVSGGEKKEITTWHNIVAYGKTAEVMAKYLEKGSLVFIEGEIRNRTYEKDNVKHYISEVFIKSFRLLDKKEEKQNTSPEEFSNDIPF